MKINWKLEKRNLADLKPHPENPRQFTKKGMNDLENSITNIGMAQPININPDGTILSGHARAMKLKSMGEKEVDVYVPDRDLTPDEQKEVIIRMNKNTAGDWDFDILANNYEVDDLIDFGFTEFDLKIADDNNYDLLNIDDRPIDSLGKAFMLRSDLTFEGVGKYGFPEIIKDKIYITDENINTWIGRDTESNPPYLYMYGSDKIDDENLKKSIVGFYVDDDRFERLWTNPAEIATNFINKNIKGIISPNFSTYFNMPKAVRIYNIFKSRWVARYMQEVGIKVIPDISGGMNDLDCLFDGLPTETPIAIQCHRKYTKKEIEEKEIVIKETIKKLNPTKIYVYANEDRLDMFKTLYDNKDKIVMITPRIIEKRKQIQKEVNDNG